MQHLTTDIKHLLLRELDRLSEELNAFEQTENLWKTQGEVTNSAGNLCLHLLGNLNTYIGANLGGSGYIRDREAEFSRTGIAREDLLHQITEVKYIIAHTLDQLSPAQLQQAYPQQVLGYDMTVSYFLIHLHGHLNYHTGQINYLRRVLE